MSVLGFDDTAFDRVLLIDRDRDLARGQKVHLLAACHRKHGSRVFRRDPLDELFGRNGPVEQLLNEYRFVPISVLGPRQRERKRVRVVALDAHLIDVPLGAQVAHVHHPHVLADSFHLLGVPQRERVVVAVIHDDGVRQRGVQVVFSEIARHIAVRPVVVVPVLGGQYRRYDGSDERGGDGRRRSVLLEPALERLVEGRHSESDPHRESVERAGEHVVPLARLGRRRIQVDGDRDAGHDEEGHHDREVTAVPVELVDQSDDSQNERQEVVRVASFVRSLFLRQIILRPEENPVYGVDSRQPVAVRDLAGGLYVALASDEVPQKVAPVHEVQLVGEEEFQVLGERRDGHRLVVVRDLAPFDIDPVLVGFDIRFLVRVHAGKEEFESGIVFPRSNRLGRLVLSFVFVIYRALLDSRHRRRVVRTLEQRPGAVLVAVQQRQQSVRVTRGVAVHRRVRRRADDDRRVRTVSDDNDCRA